MNSANTIANNLPYKLPKIKTITDQIFEKLYISNTDNNILTFKNCKFQEINLLNYKSINIRFVNCEIGCLLIFPINYNENSKQIVLKIENSKINMLNVNQNLQLYIKNSEIINYITHAELFDGVIKNTKISSLTITGCAFSASFFESNVISANFICYDFDVNNFRYLKSFRNSRFENCSFSALENFDLGNLEIDCLHTMLRSYWGILSPELTALCMAYDAQNHPHPDLFSIWASGGPCPYANIRLTRCINFYENRDLWNADLVKTPINAYTLLTMIFKEKNIKARFI